MEFSYYLKNVRKSDLIQWAENNNAPETEHVIYAYVTWSANRYRYSTKIKVKACDWEEVRFVKKGGRSYPETVQRVKSRITGAAEINNFLDSIETKIRAEFNRWFLDNVSPTETQVSDLFKEKKTIDKSGVVEVFDTFIEQTKLGKRKTKDKKKFSANTIKQYNSVLKFLKEFEKYRKKKITWSCINDRFYDDVTNYLWFEKDCYDNYVGHIVHILKTFLIWANRQGIISSVLYSENWKRWQEEIDIVVFYPDEIKILNNMDFPDYLDEIRDLFLAGCMTCLRVSNLLDIDESNTQEGFIKVVSVKTNQILKIPINPILAGIFEKNKKKSGRILPKISEQKFNAGLKILAAKFAKEISKSDIENDSIVNEWGKPFVKIRYKQGIPEETTLPMTEMITTHTMRRTGITSLLMMGVSDIVVKEISGHSATSKDFSKYVAIARLYIKRKSSDAWASMLGS